MISFLIAFKRTSEMHSLLFLQLNGACWQMMVLFWHQQTCNPEGSWNMSWTPKSYSVLQSKLPVAWPT